MTILKKVSLILAIAAAAVFVAGCSSDEAAISADNPVELSYSIFFPASNMQCKLAYQWAEEIEKRTGGRVKITLHPSGTLTSAGQCYDGVADGVSDIGMSCFAYMRGRFPVMEAVDLPYGYPDAITASRVSNIIAKKYTPAELANTHLLYIHAHGPGILASKLPVEKMEDVSKLTVRTTGLSAKIVKALGGTPKSMPQGETYEALSKGVVDATFCPIETLKSFKQGEVIDYVVDTTCIGYTTAMFVTMNNASWNKLPEDIQAIFTEVSDQWIDKHGQAWDDADVAGKQMVTDMNKTFVSLDADEQAKWVTAVKPVFDEYIKSNPKNGQQVVDDIRKILQK